MNRRLLEYDLQSFDYKKIKNKHYVKSFKGRLIANYFLHKYGIESFIKILKFYSDRNFFKHLSESFPEQYKEIEQKFNLDLSDKSKRLYLFHENKQDGCLECSKPIKHHKNKFCSIMCSNLFKSRDETYLKNLSLGVKSSYSRIYPETLEKKKQDISNSLKLFNNGLSEEERKLKYTNTTLIFDAFKNFQEIENNPEILCSEDYFYNNREIPVKCKTCENEWLMTRSTSYSRIICRNCIPFEKHKTQTAINSFLNELSPTKMNDRALISPLEIDILVPEFKFAVEYNGLMFHSDGYSNHSMFGNTPKDYHLNKTNSCEANGFQLFHIFENEWLDKTKQDIWKSVFLSKMNKTDKIPARKCEIKEISSKESKEFLENNHLQGNVNASYRIGLYFNGELVSLMTFGKPRYDKNTEWELLRFCTKKGVTVQGGGSKLLKFFERTKTPKNLLSYANRRWSVGGFYERVGFEFIKNTGANYFYFKEGSLIIESRNKFQKYKLPTILEEYDESKTETENMFLNGYRRIFDSGNKVYLKKY